MSDDRSAIRRAMRNLRELPDEQRNVLRALMLLLASWDADVFAHGEQVARELLSLAPLGQEESWYWAGLLHDLGKITLPSAILHKRGRLSRKERRRMQEHPAKGAAILEQVGAPLVVVQGAKYHHERWDGTGYPCDIAQQQIPLIARVLAVADVYTALTSDRPYRRAFTAGQAQQEIERNAGTHFDPEMVKRLFERKANVVG